MGIYIKGMKMPIAGYSTTISIHADGTVYVYGTYPTELHKAVPVPPHGRLIDTSAKVQTELFDCEHEEWEDVEMTVEEYLGYCHNEVPTIIPASEEGEA